jgi:hypothetical protein
MSAGQGVVQARSKEAKTLKYVARQPILDWTKKSLDTNCGFETG